MSVRQALSEGIRSRKALAEACAAATQRSAGALLDLQKPEGYWCGDLLADTTLESDYVLLQLWLHPPQGAVWNPPNAERIQKVRRSILERQLPDGGFNIYPGGPADVIASVKAYTALKLAGTGRRRGADAARCGTTILELGGIQAANSYVKINLSLFGLYPRALRADGAAGAGAAAGAHPVRDVVVDARDRGAALDRAGGGRDPAGAGRLPSERAGGAGQGLRAAAARQDVGGLPPDRPRR